MPTGKIRLDILRPLALVMDHLGESQSAQARGRFETPTCRLICQTRQPPDHDDRPMFENQTYPESYYYNYRVTHKYNSLGMESRNCFPLNPEL